MELEAIYEPIQAELDQVRKIISSICEEAPARLKEPLQYVLANRGKQLRPALTLFAGKLTTFSPKLHPLAATAVELLHTATLIHDDLVDHSFLRRGKPVAAKIWGEGPTLLLGDYLFARSSEFIVAIQELKLTKLFARILRLISWSELKYKLTPWQEKFSRGRYFQWIGGKTALLFFFAAKAGAIIGKASPQKEKLLSHYGYFLGMAFQVMDDLLDFISKERDRRKPVGADLLNGVITLPVIVFVENYPDETLTILLQIEEVEKTIDKIRRLPEVIQECQQVAEGFGKRAISALNSLPLTEEVDSLIKLVKYTVEGKW